MTLLLKHKNLTNRFMVSFSTMSISSSNHIVDSVDREPCDEVFAILAAKFFDQRIHIINVMNGDDREIT